MPIRIILSKGFVKQDPAWAAWPSGIGGLLGISRVEGQGKVLRHLASWFERSMRLPGELA